MKHFVCLTAWLVAWSCAGAEISRLTPIPTNQPFSFVVLGDNRGDESGDQPAALRQILRAVNQVHPAFVVNTGDMIFGHTTNETTARNYWRQYLTTVATLRAPLFHVPGNHDLWDEMSARLYREHCGPTYFSFDYGRVRFIGLDSETIPSRLGVKQFGWLKKELEEAGPRIVFVFLHRPLFPVDGAIGTSMDAYPADRDRLHQLFSQHCHAIEGVFFAHEHLYHFHERDGVPYYITGGAGAPLYVAPELGGFHHFLLVRVNPDDVTIELHKVGAPASPMLPAKRVVPGELLESWEQGLFWYAWDYTVTMELTSRQASEGRRGLQLNFDLEQCPWPVLSLPLSPPWNLQDYTALSMDVFVPAELNTQLSVAPTVETQTKHVATPVELKPGWNTVRTDLHGSWLPARERGLARELGWSLSAANPGCVRGSIGFDNFRGEHRAVTSAMTVTNLCESWERPCFWRVLDESVRAETTPLHAREGKRGVKVQFDFSQCRRPTLLARLNPPWDLTDVAALAVDVFMPDDGPGELLLSLAIRARETEFASTAATLRPGWNKLNLELKESWLPKQARASVEQIEWILAPSGKTRQGWVVFDNFRAP